MAVVFSIVIKELVIGNHLGNRKHYGLFLGLIASHGNFGAVEESLYHHLIVLLESVLDGWSEFTLVFHLGDAKA